MKKFILSLILLIVTITMSLAQDNKVDRKGLRKGEWYVMYSGDITYLDPNRLLEDFNKMLVSERETGKLDNATYFEVVEYKNGIKSGVFKVYSTEKNRNGKYPLLALGEYENGEITGNLYYTDNNNSTLCTIKYSQGTIINQEAILSTVSMKHPGTDNITYNFNEKAVFKNGSITEFYALNSGNYVKELPQKYVRTDKGWVVYKYTEKPTCFNKFNYLTEREINNNNSYRLIDLSTNNPNNPGLEVYKTDNDFMIEGEYRLYQSGNSLFDTTHLSAIVFYQKGIRNGKAKFWDASRNGHTENPLITANYKNDKLHGESVLYYNRSGKPAAKMTFEEGFLKGELIAWWDADNHNPFVGKNIINRWTKNGGVMMPYQVGIFNSEIFVEIKSFQDEGNDMILPSGYFRFAKKYYEIDSSYSESTRSYIKYSKVKGNCSLYANEVTKYMDCVYDENGELKDFAIMDKNGVDIFTMSDLQGNKRIIHEAEKKREEEIRNTVVKCEFCGTEVTIGNAKITWGGCDCFQDNGDKIGVYGTVSTYFCTQKCKVDFEKECCRRNGYKFEKD